MKTKILNISCIFTCYSDENDEGFVRVYPGKLQLQIEEAFVNVPVDNSNTVSDLVRDALNKFGLQDNKIEDYRYFFSARSILLAKKKKQ